MSSLLGTGLTKAELLVCGDKAQRLQPPSLAVGPGVSACTCACPLWHITEEGREHSAGVGQSKGGMWARWVGRRTSTGLAAVRPKGAGGRSGPGSWGNGWRAPGQPARKQRGRAPPEDTAQHGHNQMRGRGIEALVYRPGAGICRGEGRPRPGGSANSDKQQVLQANAFQGRWVWFRRQPGAGTWRMRLSSSMAATCVERHRVCMRWACREEQGLEKRRAQEQAAERGASERKKRRGTRPGGRPQGAQSTLGKEGQCLGLARQGMAQAGAVEWQGSCSRACLSPPAPSCPADPAQPPQRRGARAPARRRPAPASSQSPPCRCRGCRCGPPCASGCGGTGVNVPGECRVSCG